MIQVFRYGIDIARHQLKGIYVVTVGHIRKPSLEMQDHSAPPTSRQQQVICTLREGPVEKCEDWSESPGEGKAENGSPRYSPITLTYRGEKTTLRPWDPSRCPLAAAIHNRLIHFPIRPKSNVFAILCSLQSLSHISDTVGPLGRVIGVYSTDPQKRPKAETIHLFLRRHPNTTLIFEDVEEASFERYERLLSLPGDSRYAFLMALHPRLGENSPARLLKEDAPKLCGKIFDFLVCRTLAHTKSLVIWPGTGEDSKNGPGEDAEAFDKVPQQVQEMIMNHMDILQRWRKARKSSDNKKHSEGENSDRHERIWVFLDIRTNTSAGGTLDMKMVSELAKMGLLAKEQLALTPWFPTHALLLLQYALHRNDRQPITDESYLVPGTALEPKERRIVKEVNPVLQTYGEKAHRPPSAVSMPVPSFGATKTKNSAGSAAASQKQSYMSGSGARPSTASNMGSGGCGFNDFNPAFLAQHEQSAAAALQQQQAQRQQQAQQQQQQQQSQLLGRGGYTGPPGLGPSLLQAQGWMGPEEQSQQELLSVLQARQQAAQFGLQAGQWPPGLGFGDVGMLPHGNLAGAGPAMGSSMPLGKGGMMGKGGVMSPSWPVGHLAPGHPSSAQQSQLQMPFGNMREDQLGHHAMNL